MNYKFTEKKKISLNKVFSTEPKFSDWLISEEGLKYLSPILGIEGLSFNIVREAHNKGKFKADILLESLEPNEFADNGETKTMRIIVENQYNTSNHDHLGKLITYAADNDANYIVWIAENFRNEHINAINMLNQDVNEKRIFYALQAVVEEIGTAKTFTLIPICAPNEIQTIKKSKNNELTERKLAQLVFWENFSLYSSTREGYSTFKARAQYWHNISIGTSTAYISLCIEYDNKAIRLEYIIKKKENYNYLCAKKGEVEKISGIKNLEFVDRSISNTGAIIYHLPKKVDINNYEKHEEYINVILEAVDKLRKISEIA